MEFECGSDVLGILAKHGFTKIVADEELLDEFDVLTAYLENHQIVYGEYMCTKGGYTSPLIQEYSDLVNDYQKASGDLLKFEDISITEDLEGDFDETDMDIEVSFKLDGKEYKWNFIPAEDDAFVSEFSLLMSEKLQGRLFFEGDGEEIDILQAYIVSPELIADLENNGEIEMCGAEDLFEEQEQLF